MDPDPYSVVDQSQKEKERGGDDEEEDLSGVDFATPYIERFGKPANKRQEIALKKKIIKDARTRIIKKAKAIQEEYDEESAKLQTKMEWYDRMKDSMKATEEEDFQVYYNEILFRMHIMEQRLIRHREQAPVYFNNLLLEVLRHPILNVFANKKISKEDKMRRMQEEAAKELLKQKEAGLAKIPKDICCEYRFKHEPKKDKSVATLAEAAGAFNIGADASSKADGQTKAAGGKGKSKSSGKHKKKSTLKNN